MIGRKFHKRRSLWTSPFTKILFVHESLHDVARGDEKLKTNSPSIILLYDRYHNYFIPTINTSIISVINYIDFIVYQITSSQSSKFITNSPCITVNIILSVYTSLVWSCPCTFSLVFILGRVLIKRKPGQTCTLLLNLTNI